MPRSAAATPLDDPLRPGRGSASAGTAVVDRHDAAAALLDGTRRRILEALQAPGSATSIAASLGLSRQRVNYHVRALQRAGLVEDVGTRARRGLTERLVRATAAYYLISPSAVGDLGATPVDVQDRFSATYQVAVAARTIREIAELAAGARKAGKRLTTLTLDAEVRFAAPAAREAFANELVTQFQALVAKYHDGAAAGGRTYRVFVGAHPIGRTSLSSGRKPARRHPGDPS